MIAFILVCLLLAGIAVFYVYVAVTEGGLIGAVAVVALVVVFLVAAVRAQAQVPRAEPRPADVARALLIADAMWGPAPCSQVRVVDTVWLYSFRTSTAKAAADAAGCVIYMRPSWRPAGWGDLCTVILHERGHIDGYRDPANKADPQHSHNPNSIMAADYILQVNFIQGPGGVLREAPESGNYRCWYRGRPYLASLRHARAAAFGRRFRALERH